MKIRISRCGIKLEEFRARWQSWPVVGKLPFPSERERERGGGRGKLSTKYIVAMLEFRLQLSSPSLKIAQTRLSFHTRISTPICHACTRGYLFVHVSPHSDHEPPKLPFPEWSISLKKDQLQFPRCVSLIEYDESFTFLLSTPSSYTNRFILNKNDDTCDHFPRCSTYLKNISTEYKTFRYWVHSLESFVIQSKGDRSSFVRLWRNTDLYPESIYTKGVERSKSLNPRKGGKRLCGAFDCWAEWNGGEIRYYPVGKVIYGVVRISSAIVEIETIHKAR